MAWSLEAFGGNASCSRLMRISRSSRSSNNASSLRPISGTFLTVGALGIGVCVLGQDGFKIDQALHMPTEVFVGYVLAVERACELTVLHKLQVFPDPKGVLGNQPNHPVAVQFNSP